MWYMYVMKYYSAMKRNEIVSFLEMRMNLKSVTQSKKVRKRKTNIVY